MKPVANFAAIWLCFAGCASVPRAPEPFIAPTGAMQKSLVLAIRDEMIRLDGEGLLPRANRPENFLATSGRLAEEALQNTTAFDFYRTFARLGATYPNLHAHTTFPPALESGISVPGPHLEDWASYWLTVEVPKPGRTRIRIATKGPYEGAELVAINHRPLRQWQDENFLFCQWARRDVCDRNFEGNLLSGLLFWKGGPLVYTVRTDAKRVDLPVEFKKPADEPKKDPYARRQCDWKWEKRYPGFHLLHKGYFACLFEKDGDPSTRLLRISSFQYLRGKRVDPKSPIQTMKQETDALARVWLPLAPATKRLVVDLIDNGGGNEPMAYYRQLLPEPYFEQYVRFKRTPEFEDARLRHEIFWEDEAHERWYQEQLRTGAWQSTPYGQFVAPTQMFCSDPDGICGEKPFPVDPHGFQGQVAVLVNDGCVSTCDGVVYTLVKYLHAKLFGFYTAADTAYARLRVDAIADENDPRGFRTEIRWQRADWPKRLLVSQDIAITLSTDEKGAPLAGKPEELHRFVPIVWDRDYHRDVLEAALREWK